MACFELEEKKYTKGQLKKQILGDPDSFIEHVATDEELSGYANRAPEKIAEFDELLDEKKGVDTIEVPEEVKKELEDANNSLTPEEEAVLDGFGKSMEDARADRSGTDTGATQESESDSARRSDTKTTEPTTESTQGAGDGEQSEGLREGAISEGKGSEPAKGVKMTDADVKDGAIELGDYKIIMHEADMLDGEAGMKVTIEKPDGTKVDVGHNYTEDVVGEVNKKLRGFDLSKTDKKVKADTVNTEQGAAPENVGKIVSFEFAGRDMKGEIMGIDAKGNYEVKRSNGINHIVEPKGAKLIEEAALKDGTTTTIKSTDSDHAIEIKIKKKAKEANKKAEEIGITLKDQKDDLVNKMQTAISIIGDATEASEHTIKELADHDIRVVKSEPRKVDKYNRVSGMHIGEAIPSKTQVEFDIKGDGTVRASLENLAYTLEMTKKEFPTKEYKPEEKQYSGPNKNSGKGSMDLETARENLAEAGRGGNQKQIALMKDYLERIEAGKFQSDSTSDPTTQAKLNTAISRIKKLFPNIEITNDSREWNKALSEAKPDEMAKTPNGFVYKGKVYLNPDIAEIKGDTVAHEAQHIANEVMRAKEPDMWQRGVKLAIQEGAIEKLRELYPHLKSDEAIADEFIADATGKRVEQLDEELSKAGLPARIINQITDWVAQAKEWVSDKLGFSSDMTFDEFIDKAAKLQVRGKKISDISSGGENARFQISDEEAQKMAFGKKPEDDKFIDTTIAPEAKKEVIPSTSTSSLHAETRKDLIRSLKEAGVWDKKSVTTYDKDGNVLKVGEIRKPADEQKSIDALRGAINDFIKKIDLKLHTEDGGENKKSFQLDIENLRDQLSDKQTIPAIREILRDLTGESRIFEVPETELTKAQKQAKKFYSDVMQLKKQASYLEETNGAVIASNSTYIPKEQVITQATKEFKERFPEFDKYKDTTIGKKIIPYIEQYVRATSGVIGFGKFMTGKADGLINAATKSLSQAPGKAFRIKQTAERLIEPLLKTNHTETRETYANAKNFEKSKPVDINEITGSKMVDGGLKVSPKELNDIYLTLRQPDVNRTYFNSEREANKIRAELAPKEKELKDWQSKGQTNLNQKEKNEIDEHIELLTEDIEKGKGEIDKLQKKVQGFTFPAIEGVRPETTVKISSEQFGKIRDYARQEFGDSIGGWEDAAKFIHPFIDQAFEAENGIKLKAQDKFYPLTHGKPSEVNNFQRDQKFIDDFRSAKYRAPAREGNNYLVLSSDVKMNNYINSSAKYAAYSTPIRNMDAIMKGLDGVASAKDQEWWNKQKAHAEDPGRFNGVIGEMGELERKIYSGFATSVLGLNPFIPPKEIGAVLLGTSEIESKYLLPQVPKLVSSLGNLLKSFNPMALRTYDAVEQEMMQHNDMANMRLQSGVTDYAELSKEMGKLKVPGTEKELDLSKATEPMLMAHRMVQKAYWEGAKAKIDAEQPNLAGDAYWKAVGDIYERVTLATQPAIDTFNGPSFRKETNALTRALSLFGGQGFTNMNTMMGKVMDYMHDPSSIDAKAKAAHTFANVFVVNTLMLTAVNSLRPSSGNEKKDKDKMFFDTLKESTKSFPIFSPIVDAVINKYESPAFGYGVDLPVLQVTNDLAKGFAELAHGRFEKGADDMIRVMGAANGFPITPYEISKKVLK